MTHPLTHPPKEKKTKSSAPLFDAVIFDIDNVLIDTRRSYLDSIRWTVEIYLTHGKVPFLRAAVKPKEPMLLSIKDVEAFKLLGGFNDDWDCCYGLLIYLLNLNIKFRTTDHFKKLIRIPAFAKKITKRPLGVSGIVEKCGSTRAVTIEKISRIFQEVYLGKDLFEPLEKKKCLYWKKRGLIHKEKLIFKKAIFDKLREMGVTLGIATGRPRYEALYALKQFGVLEYFDTLTTINEVKKAEQIARESLRKPHPYSLIETARKMGAKKRFLYVGDLPDDMLAVERAKSTIQIKSAAFPWFTSDSKKTLQEIQKTNPDFVLQKPTDLPDILTGKIIKK